MAQRTQDANVLSEREDIGVEPVTDQTSKAVMLRAERHDRVKIEQTHRVLQDEPSIPNEIVVVQRSNTFYGPKLQASASDEPWMLTSPGPDAHVLLWKGSSSSDGFQSGWEKVAEVSVELVDSQRQYDLCPYCGDPLRTLEHERQAATGDCVK